jgi:hypothetical protein
VAVLVIANFTLSRVTIFIHPKIEKRTGEISLVINAKAEKPDPVNGIMPGKIVGSVGERTENIAEVTPRRTEDFAKGTVKIKNIWKKDFFLQTGAQLVQGESPETVGDSPKNIFLLDNEINVPANGEIEARVTAKNKGTSGNILPGKFYFLRMSKWNRERIWAENSDNFIGGEIESKFVTEADINKAIQKTAEELGRAEMEKISAQGGSASGGKSTVLADEKVSPALTRVEIIESHASVAPETQANNFQITVRGKISAIVFNEKDLKNAAVEKFGELVGTNQEIESISEDKIKYELSDISNSDGKAEVKVLVPAILMSKLPSKILDKKSIAGYNKNALRERYAKFPEIDSISVKFFPFWIKSVPSFESQVGFEIKSQ